MDVTYALGASMMIAAGIEKDYSKAIKRLKQRLSSGEALEKFRNFIKAQGGNDSVCDNYDLLPKSKYKIEIRSGKDGYVSEIDAFKIGMAAVYVGAGRIKKEDSIEHGTGFVFNKKEGDNVRKDEILVYIHTNNKQNIEEIKKRLESAIKISSNKILSPQAILYVIDKKGIYSWDQIKTDF
jgi:pyrimidine-nucleoside phosphorylase